MQRDTPGRYLLNGAVFYAVKTLAKRLISELTIVISYLHLFACASLRGKHEHEDQIAPLGQLRFAHSDAMIKTESVHELLWCNSNCCDILNQSMPIR